MYDWSICFGNLTVCVRIVFSKNPFFAFSKVSTFQACTPQTQSGYKLPDFTKLRTMVVVLFPEEALESTKSKPRMASEIITDEKDVPFIKALKERLGKAWTWESLGEFFKRAGA